MYCKRVPHPWRPLPRVGVFAWKWKIPTLGKTGQGWGTPLFGKLKSAMPTLDQTIDEILGLAATYFKVPRETLAPDDDLYEKLNIRDNSLLVLELLSRLENHFHVELPDYEVQGVTSFRALAERIQSRL